MILVSVIMPAYNCGRYIKESILSVLSQTYKNFELIIVNDFSNDETGSIVESFKDKRIVFINNKKNEGAAFCRNKALKMAKGEYIAFLDGDDIWDKRKLEKQLNFMISNNCCFSYTNFISFSDNDEKKHLVSGPRVVTHKMFLRSDYIGCLTAMFKREIYPDLHISNDIKKRNDYALWLLLSQKTNCYLLNETLAWYRNNGDGLSKNKKSLLKHHYLVFKKVLSFNSVKSCWYCCLNVLFLFVRRIKYRKVFK